MLFYIYMFLRPGIAKSCEDKNVLNIFLLIFLQLIVSETHT